VARLRTASLGALILALAAPAASGHEPKGLARGFVSTVITVEPNVLGLTALVAGGDDRLLVRSLSPDTIVLLGYDGEPYLRFEPGGVFRNARSPAAFLNRTRFATGTVPASADPQAPPRWEPVSLSPSYSWHDHRIHWMQQALPAVVRVAPRRRHRVFDWRVPGTVDGKRFAIVGALGYAPAPAAAAESDDGSGGTAWTTVLAIAGGVLLVAAALFLRARRERER
jgi:hypothetical protein